MLLEIYLFVLLSSIALVNAGETGFKPVRFIRTNKRAVPSSVKAVQRSPRSYGDITIDLAVYTEPTVPFGFDEDSGYISPDFSDGLEYPDPLLLTGPAARRAVRYFYSRQLFFGDIPHVRAILRNQEIRRANGLPDNRLGSLREDSPFYRFKKRLRLENYL